MKNKCNFFLLVVVPFFVAFYKADAQNDTTLLKKFVKKTEISGQWFLAYNYNITDTLNQFLLKRGYFTIKNKLTPNISVRYTQDIALDQEGSDAGNVELRLKYLYMKFSAPEKFFLKNTYLEFGLVHRPWMDFEQKINDYRVQGKMFSEKYGVLNSADFGITVGGNIGGKLNENNQKKYFDDYAGKYGSFSIGVYNGGGYHAVEFNNNKTIEGRLSVRPFYSFYPELQFSYIGAFGKSNTILHNQNFYVNLFYGSVKNKYYTFAAQYFFAKGNYLGNYVNSNNIALKNYGYSFFGELFLFKSKFSFISRYDDFSLKTTDKTRKKAFVGGFCYHFLKNKFLLYYGINKDNTLLKDEQILEFVLEIAF